MSQGRVTVGHPVDVGSGAVFTLSDDFIVPGSLEIRWRRHYSTLATSDSWLGPKWIVPYFMSLQRRSDAYILSGAHGEEVAFESPTGPLRSGGVLSNMTANMELRREAKHFSVLHWHTGGNIRRFCFDAQDERRTPLAWLENQFGHRVRVEYDAPGRPIRLVQELEGRVVEITFDRANLISSIHFLAKSARKLLVRYEYDDNRRLTWCWDALGHRKGYEYDRENRMTAEVNPLGSRFVFEYDRQGRCVRTAGADGFLERRLKYHSVNRMTRVTDTRGGVTDYYLNPAGQVVQVVDPVGGVTTNTFDDHARLVEVTRPDGAKESFAYDNAGNRAAATDACGATTKTSHDEMHQPTIMTDRNGHAWDVAKRPEAGGLENLPPRVWTFGRDARGLVTQARSQGGWVLHVRQDESFRWRELQDQTSLLTRTEFDEFGYAVEVRDAGGVISRTRYDELHRKVEVTQGSSEVTRYSWNAIGKMTERIGPGDQLDSWQYNQYGHLIARTDSLGNTIRIEYDKEGKWTAIINGVGERLEYRRDALGRIVEEKLFDGRIQRYEYDLAGRIVKIHLSDGRTVEQSFDAAGRVLRREASDGFVEEFEYDKEGREIKAANNNTTVELKRDRFGRILAEVQNGRKIQYRYDADGNRIRRDMPFTANGAKLAREFDVRGRMIAIQDERGLCQQFSWDNLDRLVARHGRGGLAELLNYDADRRLQEQRVEASTGRLVRNHTYDQRGNLASVTDKHKQNVDYAYDRLNRLVEVRKNGAVAEAYAYDANQGIRSTHRGLRRLAAGSKAIHDGEREIEYANDGSVRFVRAGEGTRSFKHDVNGRLTEVVEANGTVIRYEYDPFGRRTAKVVGEDRTEFLWEIWELVAEVREGSPARIFENTDLRPLCMWMNGQFFSSILDHRGAAQEVYDELNRLRWTCVLDSYGNVVTENGDVPNPFRLRGQYQDDETRLYYNYSRHYDPLLGDYTAPDPLGIEAGYHFYAYPRNPLRWDDPYGLICGVADNHPPGEDPNFSPNFRPGRPVPVKLPGAPAGDPEGLNGTWEFKPPKDLDWRGGGAGTFPKLNAALQEAFARTGVPPEEFTVTREAKDVNGKTRPVEWTVTDGPNVGAQVNIDNPALQGSTAGPADPHVGYQSPGKRNSGGATRGHIILDDVPATR